jgi:hypothetical protein
MIFSERALGRDLKRWIEKQEFNISDKDKPPYTTRFKIYLNKPVQTYSEKFKQFWKTKNLSPLDIPPSQPEIDMIIVDNQNIWRAIELKAIKKTDNSISPSYYTGIGQALSYHSYGIDEVALWHCFDGKSMSDKKISDYYRALGKIRAPIESFMDLTFIKITTEGKIQTAVFDDSTGEICKWFDGIGIFQANGAYRFSCTSLNPFLTPFRTKDGIFYFNQDIVNKVRAVREYLELQKTEVWDKES